LREAAGALRAEGGRQRVPMAIHTTQGSLLDRR
jgi:hypothetical protein